MNILYFCLTLWLTDFILDINPTTWQQTKPKTVSFTVIKDMIVQDERYFLPPDIAYTTCHPHNTFMQALDLKGRNSICQESGADKSYKNSDVI